MVDLWVHVGAVHRAQAALVRARSQEPMGLKREMFSSVPGLLDWLETSTLFGHTSNLATIPEGLDAWFREGAEDLYRALEDSDPSAPVWSWSQDHTVRHYLRMMPIETAVHRWDAQAAYRTPDPVGSDLALEGISHTFEVMAPYRRRQREAGMGGGESFEWSTTDEPHTWRVLFVGDQVVSEVDPTDHTAAVTVCGAASDLFLFLWRRISPDLLHVTGDKAMLDRYFELVPPL